MTFMVACFLFDWFEFESNGVSNFLQAMDHGYFDKIDVKCYCEQIIVLRYAGKMYHFFNKIKSSNKCKSHLVSTADEIGKKSDGGQLNWIFSNNATSYNSIKFMILDFYRKNLYSKNLSAVHSASVSLRLSDGG